MSQSPANFVLPRLTPAVKVLLIANVAVFVVFGLLAKLAPDVATLLWRNLALSLGALVELKVWTLLTYGLLHSLVDVFHLLFNMMALFFVGPMLEGRWGTRRFALFYGLGVLGGGLLWTLVSLMVGSGGVVVGASAAIMALIVAWGFTYPEMPMYFFGLLPIKGKHLVLATVGVELLVAVSEAPVASAAHFGGMAVGALIVTGYWRPAKVLERLRGKRRPMPKRGRKPQFTVVINPNDDDKAPPGGWVH